MLPSPPSVWIADDVRRNDRHIFPVRPIRPGLSEIARVPKHIRSVCFVRKSVLAIRVLQPATVVVRVRENDNVIGSALAQKQVIDDLSRPQSGLCQFPGPKRRLTPVDAVPSAVLGLFTMISRIPSGTLSNVADHEKTEGAAAMTSVATGFVIVLHTTEFASNVGGPPIPEDDMLRVILSVTLAHDMAVVNSRAMLTIVAFACPDVTVMRASWPGKKPDIMGGGGTHSVLGTRTFIPYGSRVILLRHPYHGAEPVLKYDDPESWRVYCSKGANKF